MDQFIEWFASYSYLILFTIIFSELIVVPISAQFIMSYSGYYIYMDKMSYPLTILIAMLAAHSALTITYWIGRKGGVALIEKYGKYVHLSSDRYEKAARLFDKWGILLLLFSFYIPAVRHFPGYLAGASKMPFRKFAFYSYIGATIWVVVFITGGKLLGPQWENFHSIIDPYFSKIILITLSGTVLLIVYAIVKKRWSKNDKKT